MARVGRIVAVTLGLSIAGAVFGALAGAVAFALSLALSGGPEVLSAQTLQLLAYPAVMGALIGALCAPAFAWLLLRHVPLGKAVFWSTVGTVLGGVLGWTLSIALHDAAPIFRTALGDELKGSILGAFVGFLTAAIILRRRASVGRRLLIESQPPAA